MSRPPVRHGGADWRWDGVEELRYKVDGSAPFREVTRQILFQEPSLGCELRYFEVQPKGYTTLERHQHAHAVMVLRGHGRVLVADQVCEVKAHDLVHIHPLAWHQFRAGAEEALGFLCMVNVARDRPQLPTEEDLVLLRRNPAVAAFIAV